jgi:hypothetical protein
MSETAVPAEEEVPPEEEASTESDTEEGTKYDGGEIPKAPSKD